MELEALNNHLSEGDVTLAAARDDCGDLIALVRCDCWSMTPGKFYQLYILQADPEPLAAVEFSKAGMRKFLASALAALETEEVPTFVVDEMDA